MIMMERKQRGGAGERFYEGADERRWSYEQGSGKAGDMTGVPMARMTCCRTAQFKEVAGVTGRSGSGFTELRKKDKDGLAFHRPGQVVLRSVKRLACVELVQSWCVPSSLHCRSVDLVEYTFNQNSPW